MRLLPSDPDIDTLVSRIMKGDIDLQPDFQRGEVWSDIKKQRLIDSILREWHVPPIHVIEDAASAKQEVLDGQQRLAAIRDFVLGKIQIDGTIEPSSPEILALDGVTYETLPPEWRRRFGQFTIRVFRIVSYAPGEPYELFFRLNQPANLTAAEQRNAFYGPAREQVKRLTAQLGQVGIDKDYIGFSNSRMAYDDVVARLCMSLEHGTLESKVTAAVLTERYRSREAFAPEVVLGCERAIRLFGESREFVTARLKLNKATFYSWLWFISDAQAAHLPVQNPELLGRFLTFFESHRTSATNNREVRLIGTEANDGSDIVRLFMPVYNDRSSARVADTSSVLARDVVIWIGLFAFVTTQHPNAKSHDRKSEALRTALQQIAHSNTLQIDRIVDGIAQTDQWGKHL